MKSRRHFVKQGALVTTALLATRPFKALANISSSFNAAGNHHHLVLLHTADEAAAASGKTARYIRDIKNGETNTLFVHTGHKASHDLEFDARHSSDYQVISKAGVKTGIISIAAGESNAIDKVNELATLLKKEKDCHMVICLSHLGYNNELSVDDKKLAAASEHLDMIVSSHHSNFAPSTLVVSNRKKQEVIIQPSSHKEMACGKIEFSFDRNGTKKHVHVATKLFRQAAAATA